MTILCQFDPAAAEAIERLMDGPVHLASNLPEAALALVDDEAEDLVVIGRDTPLDQVLDFTGKLRAERPALGVILVRANYDSGAVSTALAAGVREVVPTSDPSFLLAACQRAAASVAVSAQTYNAEAQHASSTGDPTSVDLGSVPSTVPSDGAPAVLDMEKHPTQIGAQVVWQEGGRQPEPEQEPGKIITVFSPKGGSGKTTISTNLAVALAETGRPVCIVDLDLQFGDVAISLQIAPVRTLADAVKTEAYGDEDDALGMLTTEYQPNLNCILAPIEPGDAEKIPSELVSDLLTLLRTRYAYVVVDTPSQFSENVLAALDASDHHVLLTNPEVPSLKNLRLTLDMLDLLHYPRERRSIIFNRADAAAGLSAQEVENTLHSPLAAQVPASRDVPASINKGVPIVAARPDHPVSVAIKRFAAEHLGAQRARPVKDKRRGLLRRRSA